MWYHYFFHEELANFVAVLQGVGILFGIYGWKKEKRSEKMSNIAEEVLNFLDSAVPKMEDWLSQTDSWLIYSRHSNAHKLKYEQASEEHKKKLLEEFQKDPFEVSNFARKGDEIIREIQRAKNKARLLRDADLNTYFNDLEMIIKKLPSALRKVHHHSFPETIKIAERDLLVQATSKMHSLLPQIYHSLERILLFQTPANRMWVKCKTAFMNMGIKLSRITGAVWTRAKKSLFFLKKILKIENA